MNKKRVSSRRYSSYAVIAAVAFLVYAIAERNLREHIEIRQAAPVAKKEDRNWVPNDTVTGTVLAANFAQSQRDWAMANYYLDKLTDPSANDTTTMLRMMLLALSAGQFDRAVTYAQKLETEAKTEDTAESLDAMPAADGRDLASLVLLAQSVRGGDLPEAQKMLNGLRSPALVAFVQPVLNNWIRAGLKQPLDAGVDGLSLLQALHRGLAAEWAGQKDVANRVFDALARIPLTPTGTLMVAAYNIRQGRADAARAALNEALRLNPMDIDAKAMLDALNQGQSPALKPQWSFHLQGVSAGVGLAFMDLAQMMVSDQAGDSGLIFAQLGRMIRPDVPGLSLLVGSIFQEQKRDDEAARVFESVQVSDIDYVDAQIRLSELRASQDNPAAAIRILENLMQKSPGPRVAYALGEINRQNKNYRKAVEAYDQAIQLSGGKADDDLWSVYFVRAMAYDELGEWPKAETDLKTALEYRPDNPHVLNFLGYSWADKGMHLNEARDMIIRALARTPADPYITDSLGWVYYRQGDLVQATDFLERAVSLKPYDPVLNDHLGDVYDRTGRKLEARYQWRRALDYADAVKDAELIEQVKKKLGDGGKHAAQ